MSQRILKFRAWNIEKKYMVEWDVIKSWHFYIIDLPQWEFMQFTGLHDKNGKEIWEGDIVRNPQDEVGKVVYSTGSFWAQFIPPHNWDPMVPAVLLDDKNFEVVGNIYKDENPELLENIGKNNPIKSMGK